MEPITYGTHVIDVSKLPEKSVNALIKRGLSHVLGNEVAAQVTGAIRSELGGEEVTKDQITAYRAANESKVKEMTDKYVAEKVAALAAGSIGDRAIGPRGTSEDTVIRKVAEEELKVALAEHKLRLPTGDKKLKFGNGQEFTKAELIDRRLAHAEHGPRIRKEAARRIKQSEVGKGTGEF